MMEGRRFRLYPDKQQAAALMRWIGCQRWIYNAKCSEDRYFRRFARKSLQHVGEYAPVDGKYSHFITEESQWLREVPSQLLSAAAAKWVTAYSRFFKKIAGRPTVKSRHGEQAVWVTSELFHFEQDGQNYWLVLGTKKHPVGRMRFTPNSGPKGPDGKRGRVPFKAPASIHIKLKAGRWFVSFSCESEIVQANDEETAAWLSQLPKDELLASTVGVDRGVTIPFQCSNGLRFDLLSVQRERIAKKKAAAKRWQRKLSRRTKGGANRRKAADRIARLRGYEADVRKDFAHQTSHTIIADDRITLIVFEALGVRRMTARSKAKRDENGRNLHNGGSAKAGLNRAILGSAWYQTRTFCSYKARRAGKLVLDVPAYHTSQACNPCGHTHTDNRLSQAEFVCQRCGHSENADLNASRNIRDLGVEHILSGNFRAKERKRIRRMRQKTTVGAGCSELSSAETTVSRGARNGAAHRSTKQKGAGAIPAESPTLSTVGA